MSKEQDETIDILNTIVRVKIAPSKVHGVGLFAMRHMNKGTKMNLMMFPQAYKIPYGSWDKLWPNVRDLVRERWPLVVNNSAFMYPDTLLQAYINCAPKEKDVNYDLVTDTLTKDVEEGDEILQDYRLIPNWEIVYPFLKKRKGKSVLQESSNTE